MTMINTDQNSICIDSLLYENDLLNYITVKENNQHSSLSNDLNPLKEAAIANSNSVTAIKERINAPSKEVVTDNNQGDWVLPMLAGACGAYAIPKIFKQLFPSKEEKIKEKSQKKSRVLSGYEVSKDVKSKRNDINNSEERENKYNTNTTARMQTINQNIRSDMNQFSEMEFANIHLDFMMSIAQLCNEANLKLLILNANERAATIRVQFLYEKNNNYALKAIANIQKVVATQNEYYYFN